MNKQRKTKVQKRQEQLRQLRSKEADVFTDSLPPVINKDIWGDEPETPIYNRAYVDRLFRDGMNDY